MDVRLPDGTVIQNVPDGISRADLTAKLAKNGYDVSKLAGNPQLAGVPGYDAQGLPAAPTAPAARPAPSLADRIIGGIEGAGTVLSGATTGLAGLAGGTLVGLGKSIHDGDFGTQKGVQTVEKYAGEGMDKYTYTPRSEEGRRQVEALGKVANDALPLTALTTEMGALGKGIAAGRGAVRDLAKGANAAINASDAAIKAAPITPLRDLVRKPKAGLSGVGAAATPEATQRAQRAASLPVPIPLTKGQLTRDFAQVQFEREAAKTPEGLPLNNRYAEQNTLLAQNMDAFADQTGGQAYSLRSAGRSVVDALQAKQAAKKAEINAAYQAAREAGHMATPVDIAPILEHIDKNRPAALNAPILNSVESAIRILDPENTGKIALNDLEELRQMTGNLAQPGTPNGVYGGQIKRLIDGATEGQGGPLYQQARRLYENYANEFQNRSAVSKLLSEKRGTSDRAVAFEDVLHHAILNGSLDDTKHVFRVLEAHPISADPAVVAAGQQAAKDLRGALINHIKEQTFSNAGADTLGNVVGSEAKLKRIINELDRDGKLDAVFGKQGAQQLRDVRDLATDLYTSPNGSINHSNNANRIVAALNKAAGIGGGVPLVGPAVRYAAKQVQSHALKKQVNDALMPLDKLPRKQ